MRLEAPHGHHERLAEQQFDVILAADVTYDIEVIADLARTIADALRTSRQPRAAKCVLFATHRNATTFDAFRAAVAENGCGMTEEAVTVQPHAAFPPEVVGAVKEAAAKLQGMAATGALNSTFWSEMPDLLRRHVITLAA